MKDIRCVLSDLGKVVVDFDNPKTTRRFAEHSSEPLAFIDSVLWSPNHGLYKPYEAGETTTEEFREAVRLACDLDPKMSDALFDDIYGDVFTHIEPVQHLWKRLREDVGMTLTAVSNIDEIRWKKLASMGIEQHFDHVVLSYVEKLAKPDRELMVRSLARSGHPADVSVFIDDKPDNLPPAVELGIRVHQYQNLDGLLAFMRGTA